MGNKSNGFTWGNWYTSMDQVTAGGEQVGGDPKRLLPEALDEWQRENNTTWQIRLVFSPADLFDNHWGSDSVFSVFDAAYKAKKQLFVFLSNHPENLVYMSNWWMRDRKIKKAPGNMILMARATTSASIKSAIAYFNRTDLPAGLFVVPVQGPVSLPAEATSLSWVVAGGAHDGFDEGIVPAATHWLYGIFDQCERYGIPFWFNGYGRFVDVDEAVASGAWADFKEAHPDEPEPDFYYSQGHPVPYVKLPPSIMPVTIRGHAARAMPAVFWQLLDRYWPADPILHM